MHRFTVTFTKDIYDRIWELAKKDDRSMSFIVEKLVKQSLRQKDRKINHDKKDITFSNTANQC